MHGQQNIKLLGLYALSSVTRTAVPLIAAIFAHVYIFPGKEIPAQSSPEG